MILVLGIVILLALLIFWNALFVSLAITNLYDFGKFYDSFQAFLNNDEMYGQTPRTFTREGALNYQHHWNLNAPHFHLLLLPIIFFSPHIALGLWELMNFLALYKSVQIIFREVGIAHTVWNIALWSIGILAFSGTGLAIMAGQLAWVLLLPITLSWAYARHDKWVLAGVWLGLAMSLKPFLFIFCVYYLHSRRRPALISSIATCVGIFTLGLLIFKFHTYVSWLQVLALVDWAWFHNNASLLGFITRAFTETPMYEPFFYQPQLVGPLWMIGIIAIGLLTAFVTTVDTSKNFVDRSYGLLLFAAFLISPLGWNYYLIFALAPMTSLVNSWWVTYRKGKENFQGALQKARNVFFFMAFPGLLIPLVVGELFQPSSLATITLASAYFFSALFLWLSLIIDWRIDAARVSP